METDMIHFHEQRSYPSPYFEADESSPQLLDLFL
jgi:hypothetical protein